MALSDSLGGGGGGSYTVESLRFVWLGFLGLVFKILRGRLL